VTRYVALLRALNVGGHTVTMARLQELFVELGLDNVSTFIASGNVIFDTKARSRKSLEARIAGHLGTRLGYGVPTFLRTPDELAAIAGRRVYPAKALAAQGVRLFIGFLPDVPAPAAARKALALQASTDELKLFGSELYWLCRVPVGDAAFTGAGLERALGVPVTVRNVTTVRKLAERSQL